MFFACRTHLPFALKFMLWSCLSSSLYVLCVSDLTASPDQGQPPHKLVVFSTPSSICFAGGFSISIVVGIYDGYLRSVDEKLSSFLTCAMFFVLVKRNRKEGEKDLILCSNSGRYISLTFFFSMHTTVFLCVRVTVTSSPALKSPPVLSLLSCLPCHHAHFPRLSRKQRVKRRHSVQPHHYLPAATTTASLVLDAYPPFINKTVSLKRSLAHVSKRCGLLLELVFLSHW